MTRTQPIAAVLIICLLTLPAHAQSAADEPGYAIVLISTVTPALVFDTLIAVNLISKGHVRKGFSVNAIVFGGIALGLGSILALTFHRDTRVKPIWVPLAASVAVAGAGSAMLGVYALIRGRPPEPVLELPADPERPTDPAYPDPPAYPDESVPITPPPLPNEAPTMRLLPMFGISPTGGFFFGVSGAL